VIGELDTQMPRLVALQPDVIVVGGDHSTPSLLKSHSWHPVPIMIYSKHCRPDGIAEYGRERADMVVLVECSQRTLCQLRWPTLSG